MTVTGRVAKNTIYLLIAQVLGQALAFAAAVLIARRLSVREFGVFSFAQAFPQLFLIMADMGLEILMMREVAVRREQAREYIGKLIPLKLLLMLAALGMTVAALAVSGREPDKIAATLVLTAYVLGRSVIGFLMALFRGYEEMHLLTPIILVEYGLALLLMFFLIHPGDGAMKAAILYVVALSVALSVSIFMVIRRIGVPRPAVDVRLWVATLAMSWPIALTGLSATLSNNVDLVMLEFIGGGAESVARFRACDMVLRVVGYFQNALAWSAFPVISRFYVSEPQALRKGYEKVSKAITITGLPMCVGGAVLAGPILGAIFGPEYASAARTLVILSAGVAFASYAAFYSAFSTGIHRQKEYGIIYIICTALNIALNAVLIPRYGMEGAAAATLAGNAVLIIVVYFRIIRPYSGGLAAGLYVRVGASLAAMAAVVYLVRGWSIFASIPLGAAVYAAAIFALRPYSAEDADLLKRAVGKNKKNSG